MWTEHDIAQQEEVDMPKDKKEIKKDILDKFRELDAEEDYILPENWLNEEYLQSLDTYGMREFKVAIKELVSQGLVKDIEAPTFNLRLTEKGANLIH
jgi:hypothetical protein